MVKSMAKQRTIQRNQKSWHVTDLLGVLSKHGSLKILILADNGIRAHTDAHLQVGLSRRQYYSRLSLLVKMGLIEKVGHSYLQTSYGTVVCRNYIPRLETAVKNSG